MLILVRKAEPNHDEVLMLVRPVNLAPIAIGVRVLEIDRARVKLGVTATEVVQVMRGELLGEPANVRPS